MEPRRRNNTAIKQLLLSKGFSESVAKPVAMNELCYWREKEVDAVFGRLSAMPDEIRNAKLPSFSVELSAAERAADLGPTDFVKPSWEQVQASAAVLGALCVNRKGEFCNNPAEGYTALSHVWAQGLGSDDRNRGLHRSLIDRVFAQVAPLGVQWIWTDSLAIPGGGDELDFAEEEVKAMLINAMADIYRKASQVVVFDALALRLASVDAVDAAIILCCGRWITRVWTYQEIKLATNAVVATKNGFVAFASIVDALRSKAHHEVGEGYDSTKMGRYPSLFRTFFRLQRNDQLGVSLPDIAIGCGYRDAFDKLDYARSVFPTLGLEWRFGDTIEDAMAKIYQAQKRHATRLVLFHGPPRASYPGWAPAVFPGLVDSKVISPGTWKLRGMAREWLASKINKLVPSKPGCVILELDNCQNPGAYSLCHISDGTKTESPRSVELFEEAVRSGTSYLLSEEPLVPQQAFARVGLLVERFTKATTSYEGWVCLTVAIGETQESYKAERQEWLLLHENPASERGKQKSELNYMLVQSPQSAPPGFQAEHELHAAAQAGDTATLLSIADGPGYVDLNAQDSRGWTALHYAAAGGHASTIRVLAGRGPRLAVPTVNDETPLVLAVDNGHQDAVCELVEAGADVNDFAPRGPSPLVTAARRDDKEMVRLLLCLGADPSLADGYSIMPLLSGIHARDNAANDDDDDDRVLTELLDAGADVNALAPSTGVGAIGFAAHQGNVRAARMLLARGAGPDGNPALPPPLQQALDDRNAAMVEALLEHGAQVSGPGVRFRDGWSAMMWAAAAGDVPIGRLLHGRDPDLLYAAGGKEKWTPLHVAAAKGNTFFAKWIREESKKSGHRWDERDYKGRTASQLRNGDE